MLEAICCLTLLLALTIFCMQRASGFTTRAHVVRAMLEAICFQTREVLDAMRAGGCGGDTYNAWVSMRLRTS